MIMKNLIKQIDWGKNNGLVPAIVQDAANGAVLMLGYMSRESLEKTLKTGQMWFYSRSRKRLWMKGETSGNFLKVLEILPDCDRDVVLIKSLPAGPTCHTGAYSCFGVSDENKNSELLELFETIQERRKNMPRGSYTASLFKSGTDKILLKVAEEALEVIQAANKETKKRLVEETADLIYHLFVLLANKRISLREIGAELQKRKK